MQLLTRGSPGTSADKEGGIKLIANCINEAHEKTSSVKLVLENAAGQNNSIGSRFEDLRDIISLVKGNEISPRRFRGLIIDKSRVGVCIDTCHAFAAGYDLRTEEAYGKTWKIFERIIGFKYLLGLHLNDSRSTLGSGRDLHANIGYQTHIPRSVKLLFLDVVVAAAS